MNEVVYFSTKETIDKKILEEFLSDKFLITNFIWVEDFYVFATANEIDFSKTYISFDISDDGFKYHFSIFSSKEYSTTLRNRIEILKQLSNKINIEILSADDEIAPFSWVLIEPNGQTSTVIMQNDNLIIKDYYNFPFGDFRTKEKLTDIEVQILNNIVKRIYPNIEVEFSKDGPIVNGDFNKIKDSINRLKDFNSHYEIKPVGKNNWYDRNEKSIMFIDFMKYYQKEISKPLCIFPRNFSTVKNIDGGSDSEEYCILINDLEQETIIYKQRRKSWKN